MDSRQQQVADVLHAVVLAAAVGPEGHALFVAGDLLLEPFAGHDPGFVFGDVGDVEVAHACSVFGDGDAFGVADYAKAVRVDLGDVEGGSRSDHAVVQFAAAVVDQVEGVVAREPVLLGVVVAQVAAVVEGPWFVGVEVQAVVADADDSSHVVADGEVEAVLEAGEGLWLSTVSQYKTIKEREMLIFVLYPIGSIDTSEEPKMCVVEIP